MMQYKRRHLLNRARRCRLTQQKTQQKWGLSINSGDWSGILVLLHIGALQLAEPKEGIKLKKESNGCDEVQLLGKLS